MQKIKEKVERVKLERNRLKKLILPPPPPLVNTATITKLFTVQEIEVGIKKLGVGKAKDLVELQAEYLKWGSKTLAPHITRIFNNII